MFFTSFMLLYTAIHKSAANFYGKYVMKKGVLPKDYTYTTNIALLVCILPMFLIFPFDVSNFGWQLALIVAFSGIVRTITLIAFTNSIKKITPMEFTAINSLSLVLTYITDILFGLNAFSILSSSFLFVIIIGCLVVSNGSVGFKKIKWFLLVFLACGVVMAYLSHFAMQYTNPPTYTFLQSLFTAIACLPFTKFFKPTKQGFKMAFPIQASGAIFITFMALLSAMQVTYYVLIGPISMSITLLITMILNKNKDYKVKPNQLIGALIVLVGFALYVLI